jgi:eukaryotic-like serine/threonine-protein kinase
VSEENSPPKVPAQIRVGDVLNGIFEVKRFIARGGMGEVFEGINIQTDEPVAIKVILPALAADPKVEAMFRKEAKTLTKLSHPALVQYRVLAHDAQLGLLYIVTDFIDGKSLAEAMVGLGATPSELLALTRRLAEGMRAAHELGAIHRDLSPDNVLLERGRLERARIIDFGIAKDLDPGNATIIGDGFAGKLGFVAPEQLGDFGRNIGPWTDVYSLGLVILSVVRGKNVDLGQTLVDAIDKRRQPMDLSLVPTELRALLQAMLVPDPAARLPSMGDVIQVIDRNNYQRTMFALPTTDFNLGGPMPAMPGADAPIAATPVAAPPPPPPPPAAAKAYIAPSPGSETVRGGSSKVPLIAGGAVAALALLGGIGWWTMGGGKSQDPVTIAREVAKTQSCSWINVTSDPNSPDVLKAEGASIDPSAAKSALTRALQDGGAKVTLEADRIGPIDRGACTFLDSVRAIRSEKSQLAGAQAVYEMRMDGAAGMAGKVAARTEQTFDIGAPEKAFNVFGVDPNGEVTFLMNRGDVPKMVGIKLVDVLDNDRFRLKIDTDSRGRVGYLVITGNSPLDQNWAKSPPYSRDAGWQQRFIEAAKNGGWKSDMIWFDVEDASPG